MPKSGILENYESNIGGFVYDWLLCVGRANKRE